MDEALRDAILKPNDFATLSRRQLEVLLYACEGLSNQEIAARLGLCLTTVKVHMRMAKDRLDPDGSPCRWLVPVALELGALRERRRAEARQSSAPPVS